MRNRRDTEIGLAHRELLRRLLLPKLSVGCRLPREAQVGRWLGGLSQQQGRRHLRRMLAETGVLTERRGFPPRIYVTAMPEGRAAA